MPSLKASISALMASRPSRVPDPEVSPLLFLSFTSYKSCLTSIIILSLSLARTFYAVIKLVGSLSKHYSIEQVIRPCHNSRSKSIILWPSGLWNNEVNQNVPTEVSSLTQSIILFELKASFYLRHVPHNLYTFSIIFRDLLRCSHNQSFLELWADLVWLCGMSWLRQQALYEFVYNLLSRNEIKRLYYPYEMFADSRVIWCACKHFNVFSSSSLHTHYSLSKRYFQSRFYLNAAPDLLYVPNELVATRMRNDGYLAPTAVLDTHPRLHGHTGASIDKSYLHTFLDCRAQYVVIVSGLIHDVVDGLFICIDILVRSTKPVYLKLHPLDNLFYFHKILALSINLLLPFKSHRLRVLPRHSTLIPSAYDYVLSCGSYFGFVLSRHHANVRFINHSSPTSCTLLNASYDVF